MLLSEHCFALIQGNPDTDALACTVPALGASPRDLQVLRIRRCMWGGFMRDRVRRSSRQIFQTGAGLGSHPHDRLCLISSAFLPACELAIKATRYHLSVVYGLLTNTSLQEQDKLLQD